MGGGGGTGTTILKSIGGGGAGIRKIDNEIYKEIDNNVIFFARF